MGSIRGRLLRSGLIAAISVGLGAVAHGVAGGAVPPVERLVLLTLIATGLAFPVYRRAGPALATVPLLGLAQSVLHPAFIWATATPAGVPDGHAGHGADAAGAMLTAHVAAGLIAATLVVVTDRLLTAALRMRRPRLLVVPPAALPPSEVTAPSIPAAPTTRARSAQVILQAPRRGPPRLATV